MFWMYFAVKPKEFHSFCAFTGSHAGWPKGGGQKKKKNEMVAFGTGFGILFLFFKPPPQGQPAGHPIQGQRVPTLASQGQPKRKTDVVLLCR